MDNTIMKERNKKVVNQLYEQSIGRYPQKEGLDSVSPPECIQSFNRFFSAVCDALPEHNLTIESMQVKGDRVMVRYQVEGTQKTDFMGIQAVGNTVKINSLDIFRLDDGKIVEHWDTVYQIRAFPSR